MLLAVSHVDYVERAAEIYKVSLYFLINM